MAVLGAAQPGIEALLLGQVPGVRPVTLVHCALALESGEEYLASLRRAAAAELSPFLLVLEGSLMDESLAGEGTFSRLGTEGGRPVTTCDWIARLAPQAEAVIAIGSCATWGGIPAARGSPTGAMGLEEHLGRDYVSRAGLPIVNVPGCAPPGEAFIDTVVSVLLHLDGLVWLELDEQRRPRWLFPDDAHPTPPRSSWLPVQAAEAQAAGGIGCSVPQQGWMSGIGGCASVGGACIGCTSRDFADRYLAPARPHEAGAGAGVR